MMFHKGLHPKDRGLIHTFGNLLEGVNIISSQSENFADEQPCQMSVVAHLNLKKVLTRFFIRKKFIRK